MHPNNLTDAYWTQHKTIDKLCRGLNWNTLSSFLEPSGGTGNIAKYIRGHKRDYHNEKFQADIDVIEINEDFQSILRGAGFRVIHDDFLSFTTRKAYDAIIANFPFSDGEHHLDHALRLLERHGGILRCLVNAETLRNPCTTLRQALVRQLASLNADVEYLEGEFSDAERKTDVDVALIKVEIERPERFSVILTGLKQAEVKDSPHAAPASLVSADFIQAIVAEFNLEADVGIRLLDEYYAAQPYIQDRLEKDGDEYKYGSPLLKLEVDGVDVRDNTKKHANAYLRGTRKKYWQALLRDQRFTATYTSNILKEMERKLTELQDYDFSSFNIRSMQEDLNGKIVAGTKASMLEFFDTCSRKHAYGEDFGDNIHYFDGWLRNSAHMINRRVIIPLNGLRAAWSKGLEFNYNTAEELTDIVKIFNYLAAEKVDDVKQLVAGRCEEARRVQNFNLDFKWLKIKLHKKGTAHITFTNLELLAKWNIFAAQQRNWLPPAYGKKRYVEMDEAEKAVIDSFQGKEAYEKVMKNTEFYLVDEKTLLLAA